MDVNAVAIGEPIEVQLKTGRLAVHGRRKDDGA